MMVNDAKPAKSKPVAHCVSEQARAMQVSALVLKRYRGTIARGRKEKSGRN